MLTGFKEQDCVTPYNLDLNLRKNSWALDKAFENNGNLLFTSYQFTQQACIKMDVFSYMMIEEINNNNIRTSKCTNCLKNIKWEIS